MQENNLGNQEILNNLLPGEQKDSTQDNSISVVRVISIRYKVYTLIVFAIVCYLVYYFGMPFYEKLLSTKDSLNSIKFEISNFQTKKSQFDMDMNLIDKISKQENQILNCFNQNIGCESLDTDILSNSGFVKDFLQLGNLYNEKMIVDEKILLTNIAEYLNKLYPKNTENRTTNGEIKKINILDPENFTKNTYKVPIQVLITFNNKDGLMSFINNVEKHVMSEASFRVLYKIEEISYDIVDYNKKQDVIINLSAYYYQI